MLIKAPLLFLAGMAAIALWGRYRVTRRIGRFCSHCGRPHPCGCPRGRT
ncbi:MAG: hypothetical protein ORN49_06965 [Rhodobacteraceae bacterium]|nr:hypothetical protein [Paracoccaceae bacterium]